MVNPVYGSHNVERAEYVSYSFAKRSSDLIISWRDQPIESGYGGGDFHNLSIANHMARKKWRKTFCNSVDRNWDNRQ